MMEQIAVSGEAVLRFDGELTIAGSGDLYQQFASRLQQGGNILLDAGAVTRVDASVLQLLLQVQRALAQAGNSFEWAAVSPEFSRCAALLGMSGHLRMPADKQDSGTSG